MSMTVHERHYIFEFALTPETPLCVNCKHYYQHYIQDSLYPGYFSAVYSGHCVYPRFKARKPYDTCPHFTQCKKPRHPVLTSYMKK